MKTVFQIPMRSAGLAVLLGGFAAVQPTAAAAVEPPRHPVARVVYDFALTEYCGLVSPGVLRGFRAEYSDLLAAHDFDEEQARAARIEA